MLGICLAECIESDYKFYMNHGMKMKLFGVIIGKLLTHLMNIAQTLKIITTRITGEPLLYDLKIMQSLGG